MAEVATLSVLIQARDQLSGTLGKLQGKIQASSQQLKAMGRGMTVAGAAITGGVGLALKAFANYETALAKAGAVSGATEAEMKSLGDAAMLMGRTTVFSAAQSAEALSFLAMAGFNVRDATAALPGVLNLAAAAQMELATAADITSNVLSGYGFRVDQLSRVNDVLTKSFTSANTNLEQMGEAMKMAGPVANAAGIQFEETSAALALMGNAGFQGTLAGTALRGAIVRLLNPAADARDVMNRLGLSFTDANGDIVPLVEIIRQMESVGISAGDAMTIFGQRAGPGMLALLSQGTNALSEMTDNLHEAGGTAQAIAERQLDTLAGQMALVKSAVEGLAIELGSVLAPTVRDVGAILTNAIAKMAEWTEAHPGLTKAIVIATAALGALLLVVGPLLIMLPTLVTSLGLVAKGFMLVKLAIQGMERSNVILLALTAAVLVGVAVWKNWDKVVVAFERTWRVVWDNLKRTAESVINMLIDGLNMLIRVNSAFILGLLKGLQAVTNMASKIPGIGDKFDGLSDSIQAVIDKVQSGIPRVDWASDRIAAMGETAVMASGEIEGMADTVETATAKITSAMEGQASREAALAGDTYQSILAIEQTIQEAKARNLEVGLANASAAALARIALADQEAAKVIEAEQRVADERLRIVKMSLSELETAITQSNNKLMDQAQKDALARTGVLGQIQGALETGAFIGLNPSELAAQQQAAEMQARASNPGLFSQLQGALASGVNVDRDLATRFGLTVPSVTTPTTGAGSATTVNNTNITIEGSLLAGDQAVGAAVQRILQSGGLTGLATDGGEN